jgi:hypothetical protein
MEVMLPFQDENHIYIAIALTLMVFVNSYENGEKDDNT